MLKSLLAGLAAVAFGLTVNAQAYDATSVSGEWAPPEVSCEADYGLFILGERTVRNGLPAMTAAYLQSDDPMEWVENSGFMPLEGPKRGVFIADSGDQTYTFESLGGSKARLLVEGAAPVALTRCAGTQKDFTAQDKLYRDFSDRASGSWYQVRDAADTENAARCDGEKVLRGGKVATQFGDVSFEPVEGPLFFDEEADLLMQEGGNGLGVEHGAYWKLQAYNGQLLMTMVVERSERDQFVVVFQQRPMEGRMQPVMIMQDVETGMQTNYAKCTF